MTMTMIRLAVICVFLKMIATKSIGGARITDTNEVDSFGSRESKDENVLHDFIHSCMNDEMQSISLCLKLKMLSYFDYDVSHIMRNSKSLSNHDVEKIDHLVLQRARKYLSSRHFRLQLPDFIFQKATLIFSPERGLADFDVEFPKRPENENSSAVAARNLMQQGSMLPMLMMMKMKLKLLTPILLALVGIKTTKALILSKIALLVVIVFLAAQICKNLGMTMPMMMGSTEPMPVTTPAVYGPPSSSNGAHSPVRFSSLNSDSSSSWEPNPSPSNTFVKVWSPHHLAYNAYYKLATSVPLRGSVNV